jgi:hypothetical protein
MEAGTKSRMLTVRRKGGKNRRIGIGRAPRTRGGRAIGTYAEDAVSLAVRTAQGLNALRRLVNTDHKVVYQSNNALATVNTGTSFYLMNVAQGVDYNQRVGNSIRVQHGYIRGIVNRTTADAVVRIIVLRDSENAGAAPAGSDVLTSTGTASCVVSPYLYSNRNMNSGRNRFSIVYDECLLVSTNLPQQAFFHEFGGKHVKFRGTTNGTASAGEGAYFMYVFTDAAANQPTINLYTELVFTDD